MINSVVKEILSDFDKIETINSMVGIELIEAYKKSQKKIKKIIETDNTEEEEYKRLAQYYNNIEKQGKLLFINYKGWKVLPPPTQDMINNNYEPFHCSGVCLNYDKVFPFLDDIFNNLSYVTTISALLVKFPRHYQLVIDSGKDCFIKKSKMSDKEIRQFAIYVDDNTLWVSKRRNKII